MKLSLEELQVKASEIREDIVKMLVDAGSGHSAGPLGLADLFTALYFGEMLEYRADDPWWEGRDRLLVSNGHVVPVWYVTLAHAGFFEKKELDTLREYQSRLQGHPHRKLVEEDGQVKTVSLPGIENTAGPLGQGVSMAVGVSLALRRKFQMSNDKLQTERQPRVVCVMSDGELQEGQAWEGLMAAAKFGLEELTFVIDRNHIQIDGFTEQVMPLQPLKQKLEAFGLFPIEVDGHNMRSIQDAFSMDASVHGKPVVLILHTIPGKGVSFMENVPEWHGKPALGKGEAVEAIRQLNEIRTLGGKIVSEHE